MMTRCRTVTKRGGVWGRGKGGGVWRREGKENGIREAGGIREAIRIRGAWKGGGKESMQG